MESDGIKAPVHRLGSPAKLNTALPGVLSLLVVPMVEGQRLSAGEQGCANEHALVAVAKVIGAGEIASCARQAIRFPLELVVSANGHIWRQLELSGYLLNRTDQLFELSVRYRQALHNVNGRHAAGDAVHAVEETFAPLHGVLTNTPSYWHVADFSFAEDECVEQLTFTPVQSTGVVGESVIPY